MEVREILDRIRQQEPQKEESFWALLISNQGVKSAVWMVEEGTVKVLALGDQQGWEKEEELLNTIDRSLSSAAERVGFSESISEPTKIILGLPNNWIEENKITPDKLEVLRRISKELELSPVGFVVTHEAIVHHLKAVEGIPSTVILASLETKCLNITLVKIGKIIGTQFVNRSENINADFVEGLSRFGPQETFPARILLYDTGQNLEQAKQELISYSWQEGGVNFFHLPKIEVLPPDFDIQAVALAGGREVAKAEGIQISQKEERPTIAITTVGPEVAIAEEKATERPEEPQEGQMEGFIRERDITKEKQPLTEVETEEAPQEAPPVVEKKFEKEKRLGWKLSLSSLRSIIPKIYLPINRQIFRINFPPKISFIFGIYALFLVILVGGLITAYWYFPKAEIIIFTKPQILERDLTVGLNPSTEASASKEILTLVGKKIRKELNVERIKETTGTKMVGDPARGEVTIYNRTDKQKIFSGGTELVGPNNLKFVLDEEIAVASESAGPDYATIPGKSLAKVTAKAIGTEGNLASGTEFSIGNFSKSDFVAKNDSAFSGGTSREIQAVAKEDQESLLVQAESNLKAMAIDELSQNISPGEKVITESLTSKIVEKKFSHDINQEASELKLNLKAEFSVMAYSEDKLRDLVRNEVRKATPAGFEYRDDASEISFKLEKITKEELAIFTVHVKTDLIPQLDIEKIKRDLAGKYPDLAKQYLGNFPHVEGLQIKITPPLPSRLATLPRRTENIKVEVKISSP